MRSKKEKKPITEAQLSQLEKEYLETHDSEVFKEIFSLLLSYSRSLILKKAKGKIFLPPALVEDRALEATVKYMSQYEKADYKTNTSFAGLLKYKVLEALYGPKVKAADRILSLNDHIEKGQPSGHETELGDLPENYNFTYLFRPTTMDITSDPSEYLFNTQEDAIKNIGTVIQDLYQSSDLHTFFIVTQAIYQFIEKSKTLAKFKEIFFTPSINDIYELSLLEIRNRLAGEA